MSEDLLKPGEVARLFRVHIRTVSRWADDGLLDYILTPGGHRRYKAAQVRHLLRTPFQK